MRRLDVLQDEILAEVQRVEPNQLRLAQLMREALARTLDLKERAGVPKHSAKSALEVAKVFEKVMKLCPVSIDVAKVETDPFMELLEGHGERGSEAEHEPSPPTGEGEGEDVLMGQKSRDGSASPQLSLQSQASDTASSSESQCPRDGAVGRATPPASLLERGATPPGVHLENVAGVSHRTSPPICENRRPPGPRPSRGQATNTAYLMEAKLLYAEGLSYAEVAKRLGVSKATVGRWLK